MIFLIFFFPENTFWQCLQKKNSESVFDTKSCEDNFYSLVGMLKFRKFPTVFHMVVKCRENTKEKLYSQFFVKSVNFFFKKKTLLTWVSVLQHFYTVSYNQQDVSGSFTSIFIRSELQRDLTSLNVISINKHV